ncbi:MAG: universal stress protein [Phycisphaerales bacterium]
MSANLPTTAHQPAESYKSVLVGTDFSTCSAVAVGQAIRVAAWTSASVHVVHVIDTTVVVELESALSPFQQSIRENLVEDAQTAWADFAAKIPGAQGLPIEVSINNRIVGILRQARAHKADLVVMGAFGDRRPEVGFGTVATACVRKSMTDVLLVRDTQTGPFKSVIAAVDFSETSARALSRAACIAARDNSELHVLHVFSAPWRRLHARFHEPVCPQQVESGYRDAMDRRLIEFVQPITAAYKDLRLRTVCTDDTGHRSGIVEYAKSTSAELVVLGTRGQTNLRDILLGSTAEKTLGEAPCSVMAVKPAGFHHPLAVGA